MFKGHQIFFMCLVLFKGKNAAGSLIMGYEYKQEADAWLRLHTVPATWADARLRCRLEGGVLASPMTEALANAMMAMMTSDTYRIAFAYTNYIVFTGIHDLASEGDYVSLEGIPLSNISLQWARYSDSRDNCLMLTNDGKLTDGSCMSKQLYFCRKESESMTLNKCGNTDPGYKWEPRTGSCYKFHRVGRTWHRAQMACHAEGGHLAIINSDTESQVLKEIFNKYPDSTITTNDPIYASSALVGFWKWDDVDGEWLTLNGVSLAEAGFEKWAEAQPNNIGGNQYCGAIERTGLFNDVPCNSKQVPFVCEITPLHTYELYFDQGI